MTKLLKMTELVNGDAVPEMQVGRGGVKAHLHTQRLTALQLLAKFLNVDQFSAAALDDL